jgi:hypothetical protein
MGTDSSFVNALTHERYSPSLTSELTGPNVLGSVSRMVN